MDDIEVGEYECENQVSIVVTEVVGPWVYYRLPWEAVEEAKAVLWATFRDLIAIGYQRVGGDD